jgi:hypothetical protein
MGICNKDVVHEKKIVLDDKRQDSQYLKGEAKLIYSEEDIKKLKEYFYSDLNNESALVNYLSALKDNINNNNEFEMELVRYLDVLSVENRIKFTGIKKYIPSIKIFEKVIECISEFKFIDILKMEYYRKKYDICGRRKYITSDAFSDAKLKSYFSDKLKEKELEGIHIIEKDRKFQRISLSNTELYFNVLVQEYFETIEKTKEDKIDNIVSVLRELYDLIIQYIELIKQNQKFSKDDIKIMQILFYAPIIAMDNFNINRLNSNINNKDNNEYDNYRSDDIIISNNKLIFKYPTKVKSSEKNLSKEFENPPIYNIKEIIEEKEKRILKFERLNKIRLMNYIKIQHFQKNNFYTHDQKYWSFNKNLLKYILQSKTIKSLFKILYPNYEYLFDDEKNINNLLDSIIFVPFDLFGSYGITFRKELLIFIGGLFDNFRKQFQYLSKSSSFIILGIHEGCVYWSSSFYSILYQNISLSDDFSGNDKVKDELELIEESGKEFNGKIEEFYYDGGAKVEIILFGREMKDFSVNEILFLLCKKSYDVDFKKFRENFQKASKIDLKTLFIEAKKDKEFADLLQHFNINENSDGVEGNIRYEFKRN